MMDSCNHIFTVRGSRYVCEKCGDGFKLGDFAKDELEFDECPGGRCPI